MDESEADHREEHRQSPARSPRSHRPQRAVAGAPIPLDQVSGCVAIHPIHGQRCMLGQFRYDQLYAGRPLPRERRTSPGRRRWRRAADGSSAVRKAGNLRRRQPGSPATQGRASDQFVPLQAACPGEAPISDSGRYQFASTSSLPLDRIPTLKRRVTGVRVIPAAASIAIWRASSVVPFETTIVPGATSSLRRRMFAPLSGNSFSVILLPLRVVLLSNTTDPIPAGTFAPVRIRSAVPDLLNTLTLGPAGTRSTMDRVKGIGRLWSSAWIPKPSTAALSKPGRATAESKSSAAILPTAACRDTVSVPETTSIFSSTIRRAASGVTGPPLVRYPFSVVGASKIAGTLIVTIPAVADPN